MTDGAPPAVVAREHERGLVAREHERGLVAREHERGLDDGWSVDIVREVDLGSGVGAWFSTRKAGNLSHRRPHLPSRLAASRRRVAEAIGGDTASLHFMGQVHGAEVGIVAADVPWGAELSDVDALVTTLPGRALVVQVADCVPLLLGSSTGAVAAVHAGRRGLAAGIVEATLDTLEAAGTPGDTLSAAIGPGIGACCYEVPARLRDDVAANRPEAAASTSWGTPALDLPGAVRHALVSRGVDVRVPWLGCTRCGNETWFSHRADPASGRQAGIVMQRDTGARTSPAADESVRGVVS